MPPRDSQKVSPRLKEIAVTLAISLPDMDWRDIRVVLENQRRDLEFVGKPGTTQKTVAKARKTGSNLEDRPWQIDMVGAGTHVPAEALADVLSTWRWHLVGMGVTFTVRMAKWVARLRLLASTDGIEIELRDHVDKTKPDDEHYKAEVWDGLLARKSLELARESVRFAVEEIACTALKRQFNPTGRMIELAWTWLDQSRNVTKHGLRAKAEIQVREMIDRTGGYELLGYEAATNAQAHGWHDEDWSVSLLLDPLDELAAEILNMITLANGTDPMREIGELVITAARNVFTDVAGWQQLSQTEKSEFVKNALFEIETGRYETVAQPWPVVWPEATTKEQGQWS